MTNSSLPPSNRLKVYVLWLLMVVSAVCYGTLNTLSTRFGPDVAFKERPALVMLGLFFVAFVCYWVALYVVLRVRASRKLLLGILGSACLFRALMLPSLPMYEIDIFRYIWDGAVLAEGVSPYRYPPQDVINAAEQSDIPVEEEMERLVDLCWQSQSLADSLTRIHYGNYPSPYPLVSQAVFAGAACITPDDSSQNARLIIMKGLLVLFDLATLLVVMALLKEVGKHPGWSLAYGWCPLLMKEISNSGHLDSIAIFFTTLAIWLLVKNLQRAEGLKLSHVAGTGTVLALAIGAKLYPVVLVPLFAALWWRRSGLGAFSVGVLSTGAVSFVLLAPLLGVGDETVATDQSQENAPSTADAKADSAAGIRAFLNQWEMNDLIFMVVLENLRAQVDLDAKQKPWFVVTSESWSQAVMKRWVTWAAWASQKLHPEQQQPSPEELHAIQNLRRSSFLLARILTGGLFGLLACWLAWRAAGQGDPHEWCRAGMLTLAWFWLTCPTQNPWYWCWVLPLLPFARYRTWYFVGAMTLLYYLRFWLNAHFPEPPVEVALFGQQVVLSDTYDGKFFFFFVMPWVEFAPCLVALGCEFLAARWPQAKSS